MNMAIHLTDEQRQAIEAQQTRRVEVIDPATKRVYVLIAAEAYERVRGLLEPSPAPGLAPEPRITPQMLRSMQAYWRDLPDLQKLKAKHRQWVAYQGDDRIDLGTSRTEMYQECFRRGLQRGEFYVGRLEADPEGIPPGERTKATGLSMKSATRTSERLPRAPNDKDPRWVADSRPQSR